MVYIAELAHVRVQAGEEVGVGPGGGEGVDVVGRGEGAGWWGEVSLLLVGGPAVGDSGD